MSANNIMIIDLDGCLTSYPAVFLDWVKKEKGLCFNSLEAMKAVMPRDDYEAIKHAYRMSGVKRALPVCEGASQALHKLKATGLEIWIVTTRPGWEPVASDTKHWLDTNDLYHDDLRFVSDKLDFIRRNLHKGIRGVVDDTYKIIEFAATCQGTSAFYFNNDYRPVSANQILAVNSWQEIRDYFE